MTYEYNIQRTDSLYKSRFEEILSEIRKEIAKYSLASLLENPNGNKKTSTINSYELKEEIMRRIENRLQMIKSKNI